MIYEWFLVSGLREIYLLRIGHILPKTANNSMKHLGGTPILTHLVLGPLKENLQEIWSNYAGLDTKDSPVVRDN